jgi:hypothetical protein
VAGELGVSLVRGLRVVFATFDLSHQANSSTWQQTLTIHSNNNRGTETKQSASDFDTNGNLLTLDNIGTLHWHYNNTLNQLSKPDKSNTTQYYNYQRVSC